LLYAGGRGRLLQQRFGPSAEEEGKWGGVVDAEVRHMVGEAECLGGPGSGAEARAAVGHHHSEGMEEATRL
jgi:hypothetical protein